jgi:hypothetical protein
MIIVSGAQRSGTSMMMKMLEEGGISAFYQESHRPANIRNPNGFYEYPLTFGDFNEEQPWTIEAANQVVKVLYHRLSYLPTTVNADIIWMHRDAKECLMSQNKSTVQECIDELNTDRVRVLTWVQQRPQFRVIEINYRDVLQSSIDTVASIENFLSLSLNTNKMIAVIDQNLWRNRNLE